MKRKGLKGRILDGKGHKSWKNKVVDRWSVRFRAGTFPDNEL